jgi:hypothetical protein
MKKGDTRTHVIEIRSSDVEREDIMNVKVQSGTKRFYDEVILIEFDHIPNQQLTKTATTKLVNPNLKNKANTVAYINGAGDDVAQAIEAIGSKVFKFEPSEVPSDLSKYDAVVIGIRAFNVAKEDMAALQPRLDSYVKNGGTLLMQYNTSRRMDSDVLGPLPITLSRKRVTDENATVKILEPQHPLMSTPNAITSADFEGWVQERGLYFPDDWDPAFTPILGMNDKGEEMTNGSLIVAPYGKGHIIYTGLSLFRELPAGVSGAYKLLANMISIGVEDELIEKNDGQRKL